MLPLTILSSTSALRPSSYLLVLVGRDGDEGRLGEGGAESRGGVQKARQLSPGGPGADFLHPHPRHILLHGVEDDLQEGENEKVLVQKRKQGKDGDYGVVSLAKRKKRRRKRMEETTVRTEMKNYK